jgi:hypothetical protein
MSRHPPFDQGADVLYAPCRCARTKFDWFWKSASFDAGPPCRAAYGYRSLGSEDRREAKKTSMGKLINICVRLCVDANTQFRHRKPFIVWRRASAFNQPLTVTESLGRLFPLLAERGVKPTEPH